MEKLSENQWRDIAPRIVNSSCTFCGQKWLSQEPRYTKIGDIDALTVSCAYCGHLELFEVNELACLADKINEDLVKKGLRDS